MSFPLKHGHATRQGGRSLTYNSYRCMMERCYRGPDENGRGGHKWYRRYGGRGIRVCDDWQGPDGFSNFVRDVGERPSKEMTLDRKEADGHYEKDNCEWADKKTQRANRAKADYVQPRGFT